MKWVELMRISMLIEYQKIVILEFLAYFSGATSTSWTWPDLDKPSNCFRTVLSCCSPVPNSCCSSVWQNTTNLSNFRSLHSSLTFWIGPLQSIDLNSVYHISISKISHQLKVVSTPEYSILVFGSNESRRFSSFPVIGNDCLRYWRTSLISVL